MTNDLNDKPFVKMFALYAETALHPGSGSSTGVIDLPIQRERHTNFPLVPASSFKGSLRERAEVTWDKATNDARVAARVGALFGPEVNATNELHGGAIAFGEARLVAFPVRSSSQVFAWITCPLVLDRLRRDLALASLPFEAVSEQPSSNEEALVPPSSELSAALLLEDLSFTTSERDGLRVLARWFAQHLLPTSHTAMREKMEKHLVLMSDENYQHLVGVATQVTARIQLNERKTTTGGSGNLWYEETLPRDCLFTILLRFERARTADSDVQVPGSVAAALDELLTKNPYLQLGGNETVGQGWCLLRSVT